MPSISICEQNDENHEEETSPKNLYMDFKINLPSSHSKEECFQGSFLTLMAPKQYPFPSTTGQDVKNLEQRLQKLFVDYGAFEEGSKYFNKFMNNFGPMTKYILPTVQSEDLQFCHALFVAWGFVHDDVIDNLVDFRTSTFDDGFGTVSKANDLFSGILKNEYGQDINEDNFPENINFPILKPLAKILKYFHMYCNKAIPEYDSRCTYFVKYMEEHFKSNILGHHKHKIDGRFSEQTALYWLRLTTGYKPWIEMCCLVSGVNIPEYIRKDFFFKRLRIAGQEFACFVNDLFGAGKDLRNGEKDSFIMFKHVEKNKSVIDACQQTLDTLNEQTNDMTFLIGIMEEMYPHEVKGEVGFVRVIQYYCDGYMRWHATAPRYGAVTSFSFREG